MPNGVTSPRQTETIVLPDELDDKPRLLHEFFTHAARRWPGNVAIDVPPSAAHPRRHTITYAELDRQSDALAAYLREFVTGECVVAILLPRNSEHIYLAQLAVLKAGAAYVCVEPSFPDAQIRTILGDARPVAVLTDAIGHGRIRNIDHSQPCVLDAVAWIAKFDARSSSSLTPASWLTPRSLAYLIYTSGTTGRPKGVMIEHASVANFVRGDLATFPASPDDRISQNSSCAYDSSVSEIWMAFAAGATLVVMNDEAARLGPDIVPWLLSERITVFSPPPTLLRTSACQDPERELPELKRLHVGGEPMPRDVADRWAPGKTLVNDYGPTECTVVSHRRVIRPGDEISIGRPVPGVHAWVLNEQLEEVAVGETGELCIGGVPLARGYLNDPELTARKFPVHPRLGRIYRTGDLAHIDADGNFFCHGRIDTQVKIRGYRIELEAIESRLAACPGVREAACRVQGEGPQQQIVAFIVPSNPDAPPQFDALKAAVREQLPEYMVPAHLGVVASLPRAVSGKLNRRALPTLQIHAPEPHGHILDPRDDIEARIAAAVRKVLSLPERISVDHDFFHDLGGDSLRAAMLISVLRDDPTTASLTVRDLYEARTVMGLAARTKPLAERLPTAPAERPAASRLLATIVQLAWLGFGLAVAGPLLYLLVFHVAPDLTESLGLMPFLFGMPLVYAVGLGLYFVGSVALAVLVKRVLIGRYEPIRAPVWGSFYVRNWIVQQTVRLIPWHFLDGTVFQCAVLRLFGARIGRGVHIHRGVNLLQGGWDLLDIGDNVTLSRDVTVRLVDFEDGQIIVGPITLGSGATLDVRSGVAPDTCMEPDSFLSAHAYLQSGSVVPEGKRWAGVPAGPAGESPHTPELPDGSGDMSPVMHGLVLMLARLLLTATTLLPLAAIAALYAWMRDIDTAVATEWLLHPTITSGELVLSTLLVVLMTPAMLISRCFSMRMLGPIPEGVVSRWSLTYIRVLLKRDILDWANDWLNGALLWRVWLRGTGMKIGHDTELSTIFDTVPELVEIGSGTFFADGIYLGSPVVHRGTVTLARTKLGDGVFLGNYAIIPAGQTIPDGVLLGVCTVADDRIMNPGTSWFGEPPFELPKREIIEADASLTHKPSWLRYCNRVFWELLRFTLPLAPMLLVIAWFAALELAEPHVSLGVLIFGVVPLLDLGLLVALGLIGIGLKWFLLGRVRPATRTLWSCWCSRWDFNYTAFHYIALPSVQLIEGTVLLNWYLRALGVKLGRNVILSDGFAFAVDPDMLEVQDGATVNCLFQAHTFEDRVLKIDRVVIAANASVGTGAVLLYGSHIGEGTRVLGHSVVMKRERLQPGRVYAGCPTQPM